MKFLSFCVLLNVFRTTCVEASHGSDEDFIDSAILFPNPIETSLLLPSEGNHSFEHFLKEDCPLKESDGELMIIDNTPEIKAELSVLTDDVADLTNKFSVFEENSRKSSLLLDHQKKQNKRSIKIK